MNERLHPLAPLLTGVARLLTGATVVWKDCEPEVRQRIYFANHTSHLDFLVVWAALPPEVRVLTRPVAARDYWSRGLRRYLATNVFRAVLVERGGTAPAGLAAARAREVIEMTAAEMGQRHSLILFPEGTRGDGEKLGKLKSGIFHLCRMRPDVELVPVYIDNMSRILPKGELAPVPLLSRVIFGAPTRIGEGEEKAPFLQRLEGALQALRAS
ncbi:MAG: lysophospholipid acyltransferase family protein [Acidobacteriota bacterium]